MTGVWHAWQRYCAVAVSEVRLIFRFWNFPRLTVFVSDRGMLLTNGIMFDLTSQTCTKSLHFVV